MNGALAVFVWRILPWSSSRVKPSSKSTWRPVSTAFLVSHVIICCCAESLNGEAPCGRAVFGKVDEMSPAPSPLNPPSLPLTPSPTPDPPAPRPPTPGHPLADKEDKEDKEELTILPARDFALQLP